MGDGTLGAILMQKDEKHSFMGPIYFASRMMRQAKKGYNVSEQVL